MRRICPTRSRGWMRSPAGSSLLIICMRIRIWCLSIPRMRWWRTRIRYSSITVRIRTATRSGLLWTCRSFSGRFMTRTRRSTRWRSGQMPRTMRGIWWRWRVWQTNMTLIPCTCLSRIRRTGHSIMTRSCCMWGIPLADSCRRSARGTIRRFTGRMRGISSIQCLTATTRMWWSGSGQSATVKFLRNRSWSNKEI